jgi:drug/metabolite transporter (DMT)-like permease
MYFEKKKKEMGKRLKAISFAFIALCALCWGPSYLFIKIALPEIPPMTITLVRTAIAAVLLYALCLSQKLEFFRWIGQWKQFFVLGFLLNGLPSVFIAYGEKYISSSLAGILNSFTLIFTAILSHYFGRQEPLTKRKSLGILSGVAGLAVINLPLILKEGLHIGFGALLVILACACYGVGTLYARTHLQRSVPINVLLTGQCLATVILLLPFSFAIEHPYALAFPSLTGIASVIALGVIGTAGGYFFYYKAIDVAGATYASLSVLLVPIIAIVLGAAILKEHIGWNLYLGTALILIGVVAVNPAFQSKS